MQSMNIWQQLFYYFSHNGMYVLSEFSRHFLISIYGVILAAIVGIPIGIFIAKNRKISDWVIGLANVIQTIPSLAMLSILMLGLGLGVSTVIVTVFLYALLPIIKNNRDRNLRGCWWSGRHYYPRNQRHKRGRDYPCRSVANCFNGDHC